MGEPALGDLALWNPAALDGRLAAPIPDPSAPCLTPGGAKPRAGSRLATGRDLRARILAAARACIAAEGMDKFQMRPVADICGISVQSIYNVIGGRDELMRQSAIEWVQAIDHAARADCAGQPGLLAFALLGKFWSAPLRWSQFTVSASRRAWVDNPLTDPFIASTAKVLRAAILEVGGQGVIRASVEPASLSKQISVATQATICGWVGDQANVDQYRRDFANGPALMLLGAHTGTALTAIERLLDQFLASSPQ